MRIKRVLKFWSIPVFTVYFYAANILMQYGYISYFSIPSSFIESSIKENILYFFQLFQLALNIISSIKWWALLLTILPIVLIIELCNRNSSWRKFWNTVLIILFISSLWFSYVFGNKIAEYNQNFLVVESGCANLNQKYIYIVPDIYDSKLILVPIDSTNRIKNGFIVKDSAGLNCLIEQRNIGKVIK